MITDQRKHIVDYMTVPSGLMHAGDNQFHSLTVSGVIIIDNPALKLLEGIVENVKVMINRYGIFFMNPEVAVQKYSSRARVVDLHRNFTINSTLDPK